MKADASTMRTPFFMKSSTPPDSRPSSAGEWIRLTANGLSPSAAWIWSIPLLTRSSGRPPAPKDASIPLLPAAMQISAEAIPFAIAPVYSGYFTPYCSM